MKYQMQVHMRTCDHPVKYEWRSVHPTGGKPYEYETREEADRMLNICYPEQTSNEVRVIEA